MNYFRGLVASVLAAVENTGDWLLGELVSRELQGVEKPDNIASVSQTNSGAL